MNRQPKISVIVAVYNAEKYLRRCIDSLLTQTFKDFEVLLIDDGSTDGSGKICDSFAEKDKRFRVFHQENKGRKSELENDKRRIHQDSTAPLFSSRRSQQQKRLQGPAAAP